MRYNSVSKWTQNRKVFYAWVIIKSKGTAESKSQSKILRHWELVSGKWRQEESGNNAEGLNAAKWVKLK